MKVNYGAIKQVVRVIAELWFVGFYLLSFIMFLLMSMHYSADYSEAIDPVDCGYSPLETSRLSTMLFYLVMFWISCISCILLRKKKLHLSPILRVLALGFLVIGFFISVFVFAQVTAYSDPNEIWWMGIDPPDFVMYSVFPVFNILLALFLIISYLKSESQLALDRTYKNPLLNQLNLFLIRVHAKPLLLILSFLPLLVISTGILILFGQSPDSLVKAFTDTTCWRFSQMSHPDYLDHHGHYLCTVAARGNPKIVKPLRVGQRHGTKIIVNRQLLIANAFESVIEKHASKTHAVIRKMYDQYGFPLAKYITTPWMSDLTYILMKPLEWIFLLVLYTVCEKPESVISKQYL